MGLCVWEGVVRAMLSGRGAHTVEVKGPMKLDRCAAAPPLRVCVVAQQGYRPASIAVEAIHSTGTSQRACGEEGQKQVGPPLAAEAASVDAAAAVEPALFAVRW